jgi:HAD superfamily hydrolase (TIGR01509 family)
VALALAPPNWAEGLIFDCDGTLVDSHECHYRALAAALEAHGVVVKREWFEARKGQTAGEHIMELAPDLDQAAVLQQRVARYLENVTSVRARPSLVAVVERYRGLLPMAVASSGLRATVVPTLEATGLANTFEVVVTRDDVAYPKPAPDLFLVAAERLAVPPYRCVVYEDSPEGFAAAQAAGIYAIEVAG